MSSPTLPAHRPTAAAGAAGAAGAIGPVLTEPLDCSYNILLVYRLNEMRQMENLNFALAIACLGYCGLNISLIVVNYVNVLHEGDPPVSMKAFHMLEFWGTLLFSVVLCISLTSTPKSILNIYDNPLTLRLVLFFNIVAASIPAVLVTLNYAYFEILCHEIEYLNEVTMSFVDLVLLWSLFRIKGQTSTVWMACIASLISLCQLGLYNCMGRTEDGEMIGEVPAHFLEFSFAIISSLITFWFCMDNKFVCGKEIGEVLYGTHEYCNICDASSREFTGTYLRSSSSKGEKNYGSV
ncbi:hypothetical protein ACHAW5_007049 [Stephanodiscus triporus]|uniref:Chitin synthase export chaperone n=1 Tax=Stephanodiscus triporus TaxID=2934178 RepID=A0ABD3P7B0_9STRA